MAHQAGKQQNKPQNGALDPRAAESARLEGNSTSLPKLSKTQKQQVDSVMNVLLMSDVDAYNFCKKCNFEQDTIQEAVDNKLQDQRHSVESDQWHVASSSKKKKETPVEKPGPRRSRPQNAEGAHQRGPRRERPAAAPTAAVDGGAVPRDVRDVRDVRDSRNRAPRDGKGPRRDNRNGSSEAPQPPKPQEPAQPSWAERFAANLKKEPQPAPAQVARELHAAHQPVVAHEEPQQLVALEPEHQEPQVEHVAEPVHEEADPTDNVEEVEEVQEVIPEPVAPVASQPQAPAKRVWSDADADVTSELQQQFVVPQTVVPAPQAATSSQSQFSSDDDPVILPQHLKAKANGSIQFGRFGVKKAAPAPAPQAVVQQPAPVPVAAPAAAVHPAQSEYDYAAQEAELARRGQPQGKFDPQEAQYAQYYRQYARAPAPAAAAPVAAQFSQYYEMPQYFQQQDARGYAAAAAASVAAAGSKPSQQPRSQPRAPRKEEAGAPKKFEQPSGSSSPLPQQPVPAQSVPAVAMQPMQAMPMPAAAALPAVAGAGAGAGVKSRPKTGGKGRGGKSQPQQAQYSAPAAQYYPQQQPWAYQSFYPQGWGYGQAGFYPAGPQFAGRPWGQTYYPQQFAAPAGYEEPQYDMGYGKEGGAEMADQAALGWGPAPVAPMAPVAGDADKGVDKAGLPAEAAMDYQAAAQYGGFQYQYGAYPQYGGQF